MADPTGLSFFPGIEQLRSAVYTLTTGIVPGVARLEIVPQTAAPSLIGTLELRYGDTQLLFRDCRVDSAQLERNSAGLIVRLAVLDRRWKWQYGAISGRYNVWRMPEVISPVAESPGEFARRELVPGTERSPVELCQLCLDALGEVDYDLSALPGDPRPTVDWVYTPPAQALGDLAEQLGCVVVLRTNNTVAVVPKADSEALPVDADVTDSDATLDPLPSSLRGAGLTLEHLLPLGTEQIATQIVEQLEAPKPAQVFGRWASPLRTVDFENSVDELKPLGTSSESDQSSLYREAFTLDTVRGLVKFARAVHCWQTSEVGLLIQPAELRLRTTVVIRDPVSGATRRYEHRHRRVDAADRGTTLFVFCEQIAATWLVHYDTDYQPVSAEDNLSAVQHEAQLSLNGVWHRWQTARPQRIGYVGLKGINPDGAIRRVTWSVGLDGTTTRAAEYVECRSLVARRPFSLDQLQ